VISDNLRDSDCLRGDRLRLGVLAQVFPEAVCLDQSHSFSSASWDFEEHRFDESFGHQVEYERSAYSKCGRDLVWPNKLRFRALHLDTCCIRVVPWIAVDCNQKNTYFTRMPKKSARSTVTKLREIIGYSQQQSADLVNRSVHTVQSIELGRLPLSDALATEISGKTGVSKKWLLDGDVDQVATCERSRIFHNISFDGSILPFTRTEFILTQAKLDPYHESGAWDVWAESARLIAIISNTWSKSSEDQRLSAQVSVKSYLQELQEEYGISMKQLAAERGKEEGLLRIKSLLVDLQSLGIDDLESTIKKMKSGESAKLTHGELMLAGSILEIARDKFIAEQKSVLAEDYYTFRKAKALEELKNVAKRK